MNMTTGKLSDVADKEEEHVSCFFPEGIFTTSLFRPKLFIRTMSNLHFLDLLYI